MNHRYSILFICIISLAVSSCQFLKKTTVTHSDENKSEEITTENLSYSDTLTQVEEVFPMEYDENLIIERSNEPEYILDESSTANNHKVDSLSILEHFLNDSTNHALFYKNKYSNTDNISENHSMLTGSALADQLDQLAAVKYFNKYEFITDPTELNKYGYNPHEVPVFSDSIYEFRIEMLNVQTPVRLTYNQHVKSFIHVYAKKGRHQTARRMALLTFPGPELYAARANSHVPYISYKSFKCCAAATVDL